jgi:hypothetical protein
MRNELLRIQTVYSTNYDLLIYWSVMTDHPADFRDFFWGPGGRSIPPIPMCRRP